MSHFLMEILFFQLEIILRPLAKMLCLWGIYYCSVAMSFCLDAKYRCLASNVFWLHATDFCQPEIGLRHTAKTYSLLITHQRRNNILRHHFINLRVCIPCTISAGSNNHNPGMV